MVYDSKFCGGDLSPSLMNQLAVIYSKLQKKGEKEVPMLTVDIPSVQQIVVSLLLPLLCMLP